MQNISEMLILDTIKTAIDYSSRLDKDLQFVMEAQKQVIDTSQESLLEIDNAFDDITKYFLDVLNRRRESLKNKVIKIQEEGIAPLRACSELIKKKLQNTQKFMCEGNYLLDLHKQGCADIDLYLKFLDQSSSLGSLPAVPNLEEVPAITFRLNMDSLQSLLTSTVYSAGTVSKMGPVQITTVQEKPGALLVHWEEVEEWSLDEPCYRLQVATGDHCDWRNSLALYHDVCTTNDSSCLVRDLRLGESYTLRVSCRDPGGDWSAWSLPRVASTNIPPFCWLSQNPHYTTSVEGKIAKKNDGEKLVLLSSLKQFGPGNSIELTKIGSTVNKFILPNLTLALSSVTKLGCYVRPGPMSDDRAKVLECPGQCQACDGVGLVDSLERSDTLVQKGCIFINAQGCIFVDGVEKTTKLPSLMRGSKMTFICEPLTDTRVRVHVESGNKAVTYDWRVSSTLLHFATLSSSAEWKIMVE